MESYDSRDRLANIVKSLKNQKIKYLLVKGSSLTAIFFLITIGLVSILSLISSNLYYFAALKALTVSLLVFGIIKFAVIPIYKSRSEDNFLNVLNSLSTGLGEDTLNALELSSSLKQSNKLGISQDLALSHIVETTLRLQSFDLSKVYPTKNPKNYVLALLAGAVFALLTVFIIPGNFPSYLFSTNFTPKTSGPELKLADIEITYKFPEYMKLQPQVVKGSSGGVNAIKGTEVSFEANPINSFKEGKLLLENGVSVPVTKNNGKIKTSFTILNSGSFVIKESSSGLMSKPFNIIAEVDKEPQIKISSPSGETVELGSEDNIEIFYEAQDDFSISKLALSWENQRTQSETPIPIKDTEMKALEGKLLWGPRGVDPKNGETIKLKLLAYDNNTISGPNVGVSNHITIKLKNAKSKHKEALNYAEQFMEELIDILGDEINLKQEIESKKSQSASLSLDTKEILKKQKGLTLKIEHAISTLDITLSIMEEDEYSDYTFFVGLTNMGLRLNNLLDERKYFIESFAKIDIGRLEKLMTREIIEFEDDILLLDSMLKADKLIDSLRSSTNLLNEYKELSELLSQLQESNDPELNQQIQNKLDQIKELMSQLAKQVNGLSGDIQEGFLNQDAFKATDMQKQLDQISKLAQEGNIEQALKTLESISQNLQNMMASLENGMQSFGSSMMAKEMNRLNELIARIEKIEREESSLKDQTSELKKTLMENPNPEGENIRDFIDKEIKKTEELTRNLKQASAKISENIRIETNPQGSYLIEKMIEKTEHLSNWLKAMDFDEAKKNAKSIQESTQGLNDMSRLDFGNLGKASDEINRASQLAKEISNDLEQYTSNKHSKGEFGVIAERQDEIKGETAEIIQDLSDTGGGVFITPGFGKNINKAENFMGNASQDLRGRQVSKAISNQEESLKALQEAKQQAQEMIQQMKMSARGNGSPAPMMLGRMQSGHSPQGTDNRFVEIPKVDESQIGKEYKQMILEAMKGGSPEGYIELNKKYYDRIIK